jgi:hypothetical protein
MNIHESVKQIREEKMALIAAIHKLIYEFTTNTHLVVNRIEIHPIQSMKGIEGYLVDVEIKL